MGRWIFLFIAAFGLSSYPQFISWEIQNISNQSYKIIIWCRLTILNRKKNTKKIPKLYQELFYEINRRLRLQVSKCKIPSPKFRFCLHLEFFYHFQPFRIVKSPPTLHGVIVKSDQYAGKRLLNGTHVYENFFYHLFYTQINPKPW